MLDEVMIGGYLEESSKKSILSAITGHEALVDEASEDSKLSNKK
jgi:hypothetical protein